MKEFKDLSIAEMLAVAGFTETKKDTEVCYIMNAIISRIWENREKNRDFEDMFDDISQDEVIQVIFKPYQFSGIPFKGNKAKCGQYEKAMDFFDGDSNGISTGEWLTMKSFIQIAESVLISRNPVIQQVTHFHSNKIKKPESWNKKDKDGKTLVEVMKTEENTYYRRG